MLTKLKYFPELVKENTFFFSSICLLNLCCWVTPARAASCGAANSQGARGQRATCGEQLVSYASELGVCTAVPNLLPPQWIGFGDSPTRCVIQYRKLESQALLNTHKPNSVGIRSAVAEQRTNGGPQQGTQMKAMINELLNKALCWLAAIALQSKFFRQKDCHKLSLKRHALGFRLHFVVPFSVGRKVYLPFNYSWN